jgi:hypothetical protein
MTRTSDNVMRWQCSMLRAAAVRSQPQQAAFPLECAPRQPRRGCALRVLGVLRPVSFRELLESWRTSAAAPRTAKTYTVRLPVDEAAQLAALADMFPGRAAEQLITELLSAALREVAAAMPYVAGRRVISTDEQGDPVYEDVGPTPRFMELSRSHRRELEAARRSPARRARAAAKKKSRARD